MARPVWSGAINFGLVNIPVALYSATEDHTVHFNQFQRGTADRIRYQRVNERTGDEVDYDDIVKGREVRGGDFVIVEPEELDEVAPGRSRTIDITGFVELEEIDPIFFQKTYYIAPRGEEYRRSYGLLHQAMRRTGRAGIALFVMRGKQYLTAVRADDQVLTLQTMFFADEVRDARKTLDTLPGRTKVGKQELDSAVQLIESLAMKWEPSDYHDTYRERVEDLVKAKRRGKQVVTEGEPPEATNVVDLTKALERSVEEARGRRRKKGSSAKKQSARRKQPAKRTQARKKAAAR